MSKKLSPIAIDFIRLILSDDLNFFDLPDEEYETEFWKRFPNIPYKELCLSSDDWKGIFIEAENLGEFDVGLKAHVFVGGDIESKKAKLREILKTQ